MEIMEFCKKVKRSLSLYVGSGVSIHMKQITKNNGVILHGITVLEEGKNISPNIYLDELHEAYEKGETFRMIMEEVVRVYKESRKKESMDMGFFLDYRNMKGQVVYKLIRYQSNRELLSQAPYIPFLDMAIVFYSFVPGEGMENATILIGNSHLELWGITKETLFADAMQNTCRILPPRLLSIEEMMKEIFTQDLEFLSTRKKEEDKGWLEETAGEALDSFVEDGFCSSMYVLGNQKKLFGAAAILYEGVLEKIVDALGRGYFLLPSSIHEVILLPDNGRQDAEELWKMVSEINATQVAREDVLTDSVYYFSCKSKKLEKIF